jgi:rsbT co-antagonist protein RsbR
MTEPAWSAARDLLGEISRSRALEIYAQSRNEMIKRQADELLELSTPVVELWDKILALPLIGTLDSERTQSVMANLLDH